MSKVVGAVDIDFRIRLRQQDLTLRRGNSQLRRLEVGTLAQGPHLQVFEVSFEGLIGEVTDYIEIGGYRLIAEELSQADQGLCFCQAGGRDIGLKLEKL